MIKNFNSYSLSGGVFGGFAGTVLSNMGFNLVSGETASELFLSFGVGSLPASSAAIIATVGGWAIVGFAVGILVWKTFDKTNELDKETVTASAAKAYKESSPEEKRKIKKF